MSAVSAASPATSFAPEAPSGWVWGRALDLLVGCGLGYALLMPLLLWIASELELREWPVLVSVSATLLVSGPHYGATLLRAYQERSERRKYALFTVWVSLGLLLVTGAALHSVWLGSLLLTLYVTWSPWHFAGQNYGLTLLFLRRRGIAIDPITKRLLYASFVLSTVLAVLPIHAAVPRLSYALEITGKTSTYQMQRLGIPDDVLTTALVVAGTAYAACLVGVGVALRRRARWRELAPAVLLVATQALWYSLPALLEGIGSYSGMGLTLTALWISTAHSAQYLWITSYYARRESAGAGFGSYLARTALAGSAISFVPALLFSPALFGTFPFDAGLAALIASVVNLHHFILDGAIWKLRDGRVARVLLRSAATTTGPPALAPSRSWVRPAVFAAGALGLAVSVVDVQQRRLLSDPDSDLAVKREAAQRLVRIGRESPHAHLKIGRVLAEQGDGEGALVEFRRALDLVPDANAWANIGVLHERAGRFEEALEAYEAALGVMPEDRKALLRSASVSLDLASRSPDAVEAAAHRSRAIDRLERILARAPGHVTASRGLARAYAEAGRTEEALAILEAAVAVTKKPERRTELWVDIRVLRDKLRATATGAEQGGA